MNSDETEIAQTTEPPRKLISAHWVRRDNGGYRLRADTIFPVVAVSPIKSPADPDWQSKPYSLEASTSAEAFNRLVGWTVSGWHWSVVENGYVLGSGDTDNLAAARSQALRYLPARLHRKGIIVQED